MSARPVVVTTVQEMRLALRPARRSGSTVGLVPTMGALHDGHVSLVRAAGEACDVVVVSLFVNPLQFEAGEDLDAYPRDRDRDLALLAPEAVDLVFAPDPAVFTPPGAVTTVHVDGLTATWEGTARPSHFDGVTTIVAKLCNVVRPDRAYFGEKDLQQLAVVRRMVADLDLGVEVIGCPTVREPDGLALSSRNAYLSPRERTEALALSAALRAAHDAWDGDATAARGRLRDMLGGAPGVEVDYAEVCDPATLVPLHGVVDGPAQALVAARVGRTRLIDNVRLDDRLDPAPRG